MVVFGFVLQNYGRLWRRINGTLLQYECRLSGGDTMSLIMRWYPYLMRYNLFGLFVLTVTQAGGTQKRQVRALTPGAISTTKIYKNSLISFGPARLGLV